MYSSYTAICQQSQLLFINERHRFCSFIVTFVDVPLSGPKANTEERKAAMKVAQEFIKEKNYSSKTQVHCLHVLQIQTWDWNIFLILN